MVGEASQLLLFMLNRCRSLPRTPSPEEAASLGRPVFLRELGVEVEVSDSDWTSDDPAFRALEEAFYKAARPIFALYQRLVLRVGREHELSQAFLELQVQLVGLAVSALLAETDPDSDDRDAGIELVRSELRDAHFTFLERALERVGSKVP